MNQNLIHNGVVVPESSALKATKNRYGSVPGLDDSELADPEELEHQVFKEMYAPVWLLPERLHHR